MRQGGRAAFALWVVVGTAVLCGRAAAGVISTVGVIPDPFSPNGDALYDSTAIHYTLSDTAAVIVSVADSALVELATLWAGWEGPGTHRHWWNGRTGGAVAPDGAYVMIVQALPEQGGLDEASAGFRLDTEAPEVLSLDASPARFSPDADGVADTLAVTGEAYFEHEGDRIRVRAFDLSGSPVRNVLSPSAADSFRAVWDGRTDAGAAAADGLYSIVAEAWDDAGNSSETSALVDLDTAAPLLGAEYPDAGTAEFRVADTLAVVAGWAFDRAGVRAVEFSRDAGAWTDIGASGADTVRWSHALVCTACAGGADDTATVTVRAYDGAATADGLGHMNASAGTAPVLSFPVVFDVAGPVHESSSVQGGDAVFAPGELITLNTRWDETGYDIEADFSRVDSEFDPAYVEVTDSGGGSYVVKYTVSLISSLVPVTNARVPITAADRFERTARDSSVTVSVRSGSSTDVEAFALDRNSFDAGAGETVTIGLGSEAGGSTVDIYDMAGALVRAIEVSGEESAVWDGRNDDGDVLASGVYFVRIETAAGDAVRKVAIVN